MQTTDIAPGMKVWSEDGAELGSVQEVWAATPSGHLPVSQNLLKDYGPISGSSDHLTSEEGYVHVKKDAVLGMGGRDLYVPLNIIRARDDENLDAAVSEAVCEAEYDQKPAAAF